MHDLLLKVGGIYNFFNGTEHEFTMIINIVDYRTLYPVDCGEKFVYVCIGITDDYANKTWVAYKSEEELFSEIGNI